MGLPIALLRLYGPAPLRLAATVYVEFFRGIPVLLLLFFLYYGLPVIAETLSTCRVGLKLPPMAAAILGFGLNYAAYQAEIYRAGIASIPVGQWEAGASLGMSRLHTFRRIILPQAIRVILPPTTNDFVALFKDTSIVSIIAVEELTKEYQILAKSSLKYLEIGLVTAAAVPGDVGAAGPSVALPRTTLGEGAMSARNAGRHQPRHQAIRPAPGARRRQPDDRRRPDRRPDRPQRGRQIDAAALDQRPEHASTRARSASARTRCCPIAAITPAPGPAQVRRLFGMIFQDFQLFPHLTALQNMMEAPRCVLKLVQGRGPRAGHAAAGPRRAGRPRRAPIRRSFPAARSSAWPSPGRWRWSRAACCATKSPARWTRS